MSFSGLDIISTLIDISFTVIEEFKLFNYLMTGPKKCEDCARPGVSSNTLFIRAEQEAKHIAARPSHPRTRALIVFLYLRYQSVGPGIRCKMFYIYHIFCLLRPSALSPGPLAYQLIIDHSLPASCCCSLCAVLTLKYHSLRDPGFARGISENHSPVTREQTEAGALPDNCFK